MDLPFGLFCFHSQLHFISASTFCQDEDLDFEDFLAHGCNYIAIFNVDDYFNLLIFCQEEHLCFVAYKI